MSNRQLLRRNPAGVGLAGQLLALLVAGSATAACLTGPHPWEPAPDRFDAMIVATHPDDELVPFRGLLPRLAAEGRTALVVVVADANDPVRREATRNAVWTAGLRHEPVFLGLTNPCFGFSFECVLLDWGGLQHVIDAVEGLIDTYAPATVYTHDALDGENGHPQHRAVAISATLAARVADEQPDAVVVHRWPRETYHETWSESEMGDADAALSCHFGTIPQGNDPTFEPDQGFAYGPWKVPLSEDFDDLPDGGDPPGWFESGGKNQMSWADEFEVSQGALRTKTPSANVHAHRVAPPRSHYEYTGRMRIDHANAGVGVTLHSSYPNADRYYRLRRGPFLGGTFQLSAHGTAFTSGVIDTGLQPEVGSWIRFRIAVEADVDETRVRAKLWPDGSGEPTAWQADAADASASRLESGVIGVWAMNDGAYWDDLALLPVCEDTEACLDGELCTSGLCALAPPAAVVPMVDRLPLGLFALLFGAAGAVSLRTPRSSAGGLRRGAADLRTVRNLPRSGCWVWWRW